MTKYTTTHISKTKNFYDYIFDEFDKFGFEFVDIKNNPDLIFHINIDKKSKIDSLVIDYFNKSNKIIDTNIIMNSLSNLEKKNYIYNIFSKFEIPHLTQTNIGNLNFEELNFPFVLKEKNTSQGKGIYFIENQDQLKKLKKYYDNSFENNFRHSKFIETESNYYNHFRIFTLGTGKILGSTLNYSKNNKNDTNNLENLLYSDIIFDNPDHLLYLNRKKITSNVSQGGNSIALNPNEKSKKINNLDKYILNELEIKNQKLPLLLEDFAQYTAEVFSNYGFQILGQDWIQEKGTGKYYCLEVNYLPQTNIFNTIFNNGINDKKFGEKKAGELIAKEFYEFLN